MNKGKDANMSSLGYLGVGAELMEMGANWLKDRIRAAQQMRREGLLFALAVICLGFAWS